MIERNDSDRASTPRCQVSPGTADGGRNRLAEVVAHSPPSCVAHLVAGQVEPVLLSQLDQVAVDDGPGELR